MSDAKVSEAYYGTMEESEFYLRREVARLRVINKDLLRACEGMLRWAQRVKGLNPGREVAQAYNAIHKAKEAR